MRSTPILALALICGGIVAIAYNGFTFTTREKVVDLGPIHVMADRTRSVEWPPVLGAIALAGGLILLATGTRKG